VAKPDNQNQKAPFIRLLPILVGVAALMLTVRLHDVWLGVSDGPVFLLGSDLEAQQPPRGAGPETAAAPAAATTPASPAPAGAEGTPAAAPPQPSMTQSELDVLQKLGERRKQIDAREQEVIRREELLKAASDQIDRKVSELKTLQNTIQNLLQQYNDQEDTKMKSLVKIYENMKPKEAAKIFEQLDMPILLDVVERMKEQKVAPILAEMDPMKAKTVTAEMAQRRQMPIPKPSTGG
jgi:flagellar motility protein MotE (MotC chaperone)